MTVHHAYRIDWIDSASLQGWKYDVGGLTPGRVSTIGYLVYRNKEHVCISHSIATDSAGGVCDPMLIPLGCITKMTKLPYKTTRGSP